MTCLSRLYYFKFFNGSLPQILVGSFLNTLTHLFLPLDLSVNGHCKKYMKYKFAEWYFQQVATVFRTGVTVEGINIHFKLITI